MSVPSISKDVLDPGDEDPNIDVEPMPLNVKKRCAQALLHICDGLQSVKNLQLRKVKLIITAAVDNLLSMYFWGTQWTMVSCFEK